MKAKSLVLVVLNTLTFATMLFMNYAANTPMVANAATADIGDKYDTLFAPADYAFFPAGKREVIRATKN